MNLPQLAHLLGDIPIIEVRFGNHVLQRINSQLQSRYHFDENMSGLDILTHFDMLPNSVRNKLRNSDIITAAEYKLMVKDIDLIKKRVSEKNQEYDQGYVNLIILFVWFTLFYAIYRTMVYVFTVESSGEHISGLIFNFIISIVEYLEKMIL